MYRYGIAVCVCIVCPLDLGENPRIKSLFPPECQAFIFQKPVFWVLSLLAIAGGNESESIVRF